MLSAPPYLFSEGAPYTVGDGSISTQNPKNEPPIIKTLDFRVKKSFHLSVRNLDFCRKSLENTKDFLTSDFKMVGIRSAYFFVY